MKNFIFIILGGVSFLLIIGPYFLSAEEAKSEDEEQELKTVYEKYLPNGDFVGVTRKLNPIPPDKPSTITTSTYTMYIKRLSDFSRETVIWQDWAVDGNILPDIPERDGLTVLDVFPDDVKRYILYRKGGTIRVQTLEERDGKFQPGASVKITKEIACVGLFVTKGYLVQLGGKVHVIVEYLVGDQEMWRIDGDKAKRLWRLTHEEIRNEELEASDQEKPKEDELNSPTEKEGQERPSDELGTPDHPDESTEAPDGESAPSDPSEPEEKPEE